jgi:hypothetical protein
VDLYIVAGALEPLDVIDLDERQSFAVADHEAL